MKRSIYYCEVCGKARLEIALTEKLCAKCCRLCSRDRSTDTPIPLEGLRRLLDDLDKHTKA